MLVVGVTVYDRWKLGIGDPTITGWLTAAAFIATALLCCAYALCQEPLGGHRVFWFSLAVALFALGINKQLDLHVLLEAVGREIAKRHGWYSQRRSIQIFFVMGLATIGLASAAWIGWTLRRLWRQRWLPFCGIVLLVAFVTARAASIHHVFEIFNLDAPGSCLLSILQGGAIACIAVSAVVGIVNYRKRITHQPPLAATQIRQGRRA